MYDESHIHLIDSHTEGDCCNDDVDLVPHPTVLDIFPGFITHPSVVEVTLNLVLREVTSQVLAFRSRKTVDDTTLVEEFLFNNDDDVLHDILDF